MSKEISVFESQIAEFIDNNPDLDCINLSLLKGVLDHDFLMIETSVAAGADIYIEIIEEGSDLIDLIADYLQDTDIKNFFMDVVLKDAIIAENDHEILFALNNGASRDLYLQEREGYIDSGLIGVHSELIDVH